MRKHFLLSFLLAVLLPMLIIGCDPTGGPNLPLANNEVRARISDYGDFDSHPVVVDNKGTHFTVQASVQGSNNQDTVVITLDIPRQLTAPYSITVESDDVALIEYCLLQQSGVCTIYQAKKGFGSGTITVSEITTDGSSTIIQGTFSASVLPTSGSGAGKTITGGEFKVAL